MSDPIVEQATAALKEATLESPETRRGFESEGEYVYVSKEQIHTADPTWVKSRNRPVKDAFDEVNTLTKQCLGVLASTQHADNDKFEVLFSQFLNTLAALEADALKLAAVSPLYDYDEDTRGNGYRSLLYILQRALNHISTSMRKFMESHGSLLSKAKHHHHKLKDFLLITTSLSAMMNLAVQVADYADGENIYPPEFGQVMEHVLLLKTECFYGKRFGFQYPESLRLTFMGVLTAMASYSRGCRKHTSEFAQKATALMSGLKYFIDDEKRAIDLRAEMQLLDGDVTFVRNFWNLTETTPAKHLGLLASPFMAINRLLRIPAVPFTMPGAKGGVVQVTPYEDGASFKFEHVEVRLLSHRWHKGQIYEMAHHDGYDEYVKKHEKKDGAEPASGLLIHIHGGGFIAQSSKSHEVYLREWAKQLEMPVLSIDYSLSPEAPYPQALHECFYVYCWALTHAAKLGSKAERVLLAGDSAGANLCAAVAIKAMREGVRIPDAVNSNYPPFFIRYCPSPSRIMSVVDPLLPLGVLRSCLKAYAGDEQSKSEDPMMSPLLLSQDEMLQMPPMLVVACGLDPLLDDSIMFARRMRRAGRPVELRVYQHLPHGFLCFVKNSDECYTAFMEITAWLKDMARVPKRNVKA
eukprot:Colp12_sorted_trinity150504_noHs@21971